MLISYLYDLILIALKFTAVFGQCIEIKTKNETENFENKIDIVLQVSIHLIISC